MRGHDGIVITGMGLACSLGLSPEDALDALLAGRIGLGPMPVLEQRPSPDKGGGQAMDLPAGADASEPREVGYLRHVVRHALQEAGPHAHAAHRVGAVLGTTLHGMRAAGRWLRSGRDEELGAFPAGAAMSAALRGLQIEGARLNCCSACSSSLSAVGLAVTLLRSGACDMVIAGGYDTVSEYAYAGFESLRLVASGPPRPFGAQREGMKTAEGYAVVVLERERDARARGASVRGFVAGVGESADAHHLTQPHPEGRGASAAMQQAIVQAGIERLDIGLVAAHATSTPNNDAAEYAALRDVFGEALPRTPVVAFKGQLGHTLGGAGAVELVLAQAARERGVIPPTLHAAPVDPAFAGLALNLGAPQRAEIGATLNLSLGFGGANTCVVVTKKQPAPPEREPDEAVITGLGVIVPGAIGNAEFAGLIANAERGSAGPAILPGPIGEEAIAHLVNSRRTRRMSEYVKLSLAATTLACEHAGIMDAAEFAREACVLLGSLHGSPSFCESYYGQIVREGIAAANPALFAEGVPNAAAAQLSLMLGVRGGCQTIIGSRCAGLDALRLAAMRIREGLWTRAIVGAAEEFSQTVNRASARCRSSAADHACAGAVTLIIESRRSAAARGARVLGTVEQDWAGPATIEQMVERSMATPEGHAALAVSTDGVAGASAGRVWSAHPGVPECGSVGGLITLAAALLAPDTVGGGRLGCGDRVLAVATDRWTGTTAVRVRCEAGEQRVRNSV